ncbi:hypothetical protein [Ralstonia phage RSP15]|uniref:hypothetical protein n=1 Tax=Ralstonia phage RSP15 TaxID=1785960 RepID=UPI00074D4808|nr:hypothetical protein BH754_gp044 [Ralstonia phage RSP15]BAU40002.1 hypothetical protein [Ralstonia phage RSP15]
MTLQKTDLSVSPYFDDYDEAKRFNRILFRPRTVQVREMNQLQTMIQEQINRFGKHVFNEGSPVLRGGMNVSERQPTASFALDSGYTVAQLKAETDTVQVRNAAGVVAKCVKIVDVEFFDPAYLFLDYETTSTNGQTQFAATDAVTFFVQNADGSRRDIATGVINEISVGSWARILEGVYFVRGFFVLSQEQDVIIAKKNADTVSARVCFQVLERIITETEDPTLFSNALGTPNFKAPGASRLMFDLRTQTVPLSDPISDDMIEILKIQDGVLQKKVEQTDYSLLADSLAQRTYETNGDYTVDAFDIDFKEHLKDADHDGVYPPPKGDESKFVVRVKPGIAYVKGYRVQNIGIQNLDVDKAREVQKINNTATSADFGPYLLVTNPSSLPDTDVAKRYQIKDSANQVIGSVSINSVRKLSTTQYRFYLTNISFNLGKSIADAATISLNDGDNLFSINVTSAQLFDAAKRSLMFPLPYKVIKTLKPDGISDTTFNVTRSYLVNADADGKFLLNLGANELFYGTNPFDYLFADGGNPNSGTVYDSTGKFTVGGSPVGRSISVNLGPSAANKRIRVIAPIIKQNPVEKSKSLQLNTETIVVPNQTTFNLSKADIVRIMEIRETNQDGPLITDFFTVDDGQRDDYYDVGKLTSRSGPINKTIWVKYMYFEHGNGDYFSVDSYSGIDRSDIPSYKGTSLADVMDFRFIRNASGGFVTGGVSDMVRSGDSIRVDLEYYMPRTDAVYVDSKGVFGVQRGLSSDNPAAPDIPDNAMRLYNIGIPAYTFDMKDITQAFIENKRYTMRDIGKLEKRIETLEYYTSLSMLENRVNNTQVVDPTTGNNRFKNGFAVDSFDDLKLSDVTHKDWAASIDFGNGRLRAPFVQRAADLEGKNLNGVQKRNALFLKAYTEIVETEQMQATDSININPYAVFTWNGSISLFPSSDFWKDTNYVAPYIVNETVDLTNGVTANVIQNITYGSWNDQRTYINSQTDELARVRKITVSTTVTTINESTVSKTAADQVVNTQIIPYMRAINIAFEGNGFKPLSRVYPFFDGVNVSAFVNQDGKSKGEALITDRTGKLRGTFSVPNTPQNSFRTGTTVFRLTEDPNGARDDLHSFGEAVFVSGGTLENRQLTIVNTRTLIATTTSGVSQTQEKEILGYIRKDPIAQSFFVSSEGGAYVTKVDVFFKKKANVLPVTLQIRTMIAGYPTMDKVPFGEITLTPDQVNTSENGTVATSFTFSDPVFLQPGIDYAIVLLADTQEYEVFLAEMGNALLDNTGVVSKQPHIGTFFTSANGGTWSAQQLQDLKFRVWRAKFDVNQTSTVEFSNKDLPPVPLTFNALTSVNGSNQITVKLPSHGLAVNDTFVLAGATDGNGITADMLNGSYQVQSVVDSDTFVITIGTNATSDGTLGGSNMTGKANYPFATVFSNFNFMKLPQTDIKWEVNFRRANNRGYTGYVEFRPNEEIDFDAVGIAVNPGDFVVRATFTSNRENLSPCVDTDGMTTAFVQNRIDPDRILYRYQTKPIVFNNANTEARLYVGALLPSGSNMNLYYKVISNASDAETATWVLATPQTPIRNDDRSYLEYEYRIKPAQAFSGYVVKIEFTGEDATNCPRLSDFRSIALA